MIAEASSGLGKRLCRKGVVSLRRGNLKGTDVCMACRSGKEIWRQDKFWAISLCNPSAPSLSTLSFFPGVVAVLLPVLRAHELRVVVVSQVQCVPPQLDWFIILQCRPASRTFGTGA